MYRYFTAQNTLKYLGALPQLINTYNTTYHRSTGMKPLEVKPSNELKVWKRLYKTTRQRVKPPKLRKGDKVRLNKKHRLFQKRVLTRLDRRSVFGHQGATTPHSLLQSQ